MVLVKESFLENVHGQIPCTACHRGDSTASDKENAHNGLVALPSDNPKEFCGGCHGSVVSNYESSLHADLDGYHKSIEKRLGQSIKNDTEIMAKFNTECGKCHASCGQCHISRPVSVHGGFLDGHAFMMQPTSKNNCTACHGSRVGAEYFGENAVRADVHWIPEVMQCIDCHKGGEMHGTGKPFEHRYQTTAMPRCDDAGCHPGLENANKYHTVHATSSMNAKLACQVCHSQEYKNCNGCHTGGAGITGSSYMTFKIAKNYLPPEYGRDCDYIVVRHIPIVKDTYSSWGITDLPNFDAVPTWKYATPHNILRWTPQTETTGDAACYENCHDSEYYLTDEDIKEYDGNANDAILINP
ncbi:hypothetical protein JXJ21_13610 [candidate division KSB1 bacterium]|nr:hypothetical protein [candidate division KSB1 bacterium]